MSQDRSSAPAFSRQILVSHLLRFLPWNRGRVATHTYGMVRPRSPFSTSVRWVGNRSKEYHPMTRQSTATVATLGIDIGKNVFHLIGLNERGAIILRQKLSRRQLETRLTNMVPCLIGMEACVGSHHLGRQLKTHGHDVRLMPAKYVRPYSKGQKNDYRDAEAIAE